MKDLKVNTIVRRLNELELELMGYVNYQVYASGTGKSTKSLRDKHITRQEILKLQDLLDTLETESVA